MLGAFGAHALKAELNVRAMEVYQTAVQYQMFHALALLFVSLAWDRQYGLSEASKRYFYVSLFFVLGLVLFCGSLYALALTQLKAIGMITPMGGVAFIIAWLLLISALIKSSGDIQTPDRDN